MNKAPHMNPEEILKLRYDLQEYYKNTREPVLWKKIGLHHMSFLRFIYPEESSNIPLLRTCIKVKKFLDSLPQDPQ